MSASNAANTFPNSSEAGIDKSIWGVSRPGQSINVTRMPPSVTVASST